MEINILDMQLHQIFGNTPKSPQYTPVKKDFSKYIDYKSGNEINHEKFGKGEVLSVKKTEYEYTIEVKFSDRKRKLIVEHMVNNLVG